MSLKQLYNKAMKFKLWILICFSLLIIFFVASKFFTSSNIDNKEEDVLFTSVNLESPTVELAKIRNKDRFLRNLKLSPLWKVNQLREGTKGVGFVAHARSLEKSPFCKKGENSFVFAIQALKNIKLLPDHTIDNHYLHGCEKEDVFISSISIVFGKLQKKSNLGEFNKKFKLDIYQMAYADKNMSGNYYSTLAYKLSDNDDIYLVLYEQGLDLKRSQTIANLQSAIKQVVFIENLPEKYMVKDVYSDFLKFISKGDYEQDKLLRFQGVQERDHFGGIITTKSGISYEGINVKISHDKICGGECTREFSRLQKAEYLGEPYQIGDKLFYLIEDNAIYVKGDHNQEHGIFEGNSSFEANLEVFNENGVVLQKTQQQFKGWQR